MAYPTNTSGFVQQTVGEKVDDAAFTAGTDGVDVLGGVYQSTVDTLDANDVGAARITARRALHQAPDFVTERMTDSTISIFDVTVSTTAINSGYGTPTTAFFDGTDPGFDANPRWINIPAGFWRNISITIRQTLGVACTLTLYARDLATSGVVHVIYTESLASGSQYRLQSSDGGTGVGADVKSIPALASPATEFVLAVDPDSDPSTGALVCYITKQS